MKTLLIGILALIATSSANSQIKLLNDSKAVKLSSVREKSNFKAGLGKIDSDYFITYRDVKYKTMSSIEIIKIGEVDKLKEFKQSIFKVIKSNESSAFKFDGKTFSLIPHKSKGAYINILDKYIKYEMGYWSLKKLEKLIPGSELD
ncbi:MAG: hypothetical protein ACKVK2_08150 [Flavobacteriales bacterium]|jgi:hypothetical protein|tara:strand:- start:1063 stop:1500 length:438 start_codon:yes stop_codon:yes gene_type:complete